MSEREACAYAIHMGYPARLEQLMAVVIDGIFVVSFIRREEDTGMFALIDSMSDRFAFMPQLPPAMLVSQFRASRVSDDPITGEHVVR